MFDQRHGAGAYSVTNLGACGSMMLKNSSSPYWQRPQYRGLIDGKWDIVVVMLGTNDAHNGCDAPAARKVRRGGGGAIVFGRHTSTKSLDAPITTKVQDQHRAFRLTERSTNRADEAEAAIYQSTRAFIDTRNLDSLRSTEQQQALSATRRRSNQAKGRENLFLVVDSRPGLLSCGAAGLLVRLGPGLRRAERDQPRTLQVCR